MKATAYLLASSFFLTACSHNCTIRKRIFIFALRPRTLWPQYGYVSETTNGVHWMRSSIVLLTISLSTLTSPAAIAQSPRSDQKPPQQNAEVENPKWYDENAPYRPCPAVATINGRDVCLGCPSVCPWPPPFPKHSRRAE